MLHAQHHMPGVLCYFPARGRHNDNVGLIVDEDHYNMVLESNKYLAKVNNLLKLKSNRVQAKLVANNLTGPHINATDGRNPLESLGANKMLAKGVYCWPFPTVVDMGQLFEGDDDPEISEYELQDIGKI